jgi:hypothetical protein
MCKDLVTTTAQCLGDKSPYMQDCHGNQHAGRKHAQKLGFALVQPGFIVHDGCASPVADDNLHS